MRIWPIPEIEFRPFGTLKEDRDVALIYSSAALEAVEASLNLNVVSRCEVLEASEGHFKSLAETVSGDVIYSVGGGVAVDAAKYVGKQIGMPVISLPTAMTVDAFFTWASGVRQDGCVRYVETGPPEKVVVDLDVLAEAPASLRAAGVCDLLSIATGSWDWRFARDQGHLDDTTRYEEWADEVAASLLNSAIDCSEAAGRGDRGGLKQLVDCLALEVQLCNQTGHSRPEEGSEHYFAYAAEHQVDEPLPHGDLVGPGILIAAHLQGQDTRILQRSLQQAGVPLQSIPRETIAATLQSLSEYVHRHDLPFGILHTIDPPSIDLEKTISTLIFK